MRLRRLPVGSNSRIVLASRMAHGLISLLFLFCIAALYVGALAVGNVAEVGINKQKESNSSLPELASTNIRTPAKHHLPHSTRITHNEGRPLLHNRAPHARRYVAIR